MWIIYRLEGTPGARLELPLLRQSPVAEGLASTNQQQTPDE